MFHQLIAKLKGNKKREKVEDYLQTLLDRQHELDRQEDNIAAERLFIERQVPRLRKQLAEMEADRVVNEIASDKMPRPPRPSTVSNVILTGFEGKPHIPQPGAGRRGLPEGFA